MLPDEVYKRRHFGTPQSFFLITVNFVVLALAVQMFAACAHIQTFFWVVLAGLVAYNIYKIRHDREEYDKIRIIAYIISLAAMVLLFFAFRINLHC
jgi:uncharacterized membrane protein YwaF